MITDAERHRVAEAAKRGTLAPTGPTLERFDPVPLAAALEQEAERALLYGKLEGTPGKVDLYLDPRDALMLAAFLRQHGGH
jgi:hypothetical protein